MTPGPVRFRWDDREMTATPPSDLRAWGREGRAAARRASVRSLAVGLRFLRAVLAPADYRVIECDVLEGAEIEPLCDLVLHLATAWSIDPRDVAAYN